jgi:hypothetical protein
VARQSTRRPPGYKVTISAPAPSQRTPVNASWTSLFESDGVRSLRDDKNGPHPLADTAGCSGTQIIEASGLGNGHTKFGINRSALETRIDNVNQ